MASNVNGKEALQNEEVHPIEATLISLHVHIFSEKYSPPPLHSLHAKLEPSISVNFGSSRFVHRPADALAYDAFLSFHVVNLTHT